LTDQLLTPAVKAKQEKVTYPSEMFHIHCT